MSSDTTALIAVSPSRWARLRVAVQRRAYRATEQAHAALTGYLEGCDRLARRLNSGPVDAGAVR